MAALRSWTRRRALYALSLTRRRLRRWPSAHSWEQVLRLPPEALRRSGWISLPQKAPSGHAKATQDSTNAIVLDLFQCAGCPMSARRHPVTWLSVVIPLVYTDIAISATSKLPDLSLDNGIDTV